MTSERKQFARDLRALFRKHSAQPKQKSLLLLRWNRQAGGARYDSEDHEYKRYMPNYQLSESILHHRI